MKFALKKGVRGAISQEAALGILIDLFQIHLFIIPVHEKLSKFTEMQVTLEMNCDLQLYDNQTFFSILSKLNKLCVVYYQFTHGLARTWRIIV